MTTIELIFEISGWIFGAIASVCAIIQTRQKNKYKKLYNSQSATAGNNSTITQIGGINH